MDDDDDHDDDEFKPRIQKPRPDNETVWQLLVENPLEKPLEDTDDDDDDDDDSLMMVHQDTKHLQGIAVRLAIAIRLLFNHHHNHNNTAMAIMITASDHEASYNGFRLIMMDRQGHGPTVQFPTIDRTTTIRHLLTLPTAHDVYHYYRQQLNLENENDTAYTSTTDRCRHVHLGRDTRPSSEFLANLLSKTIQATGCTVLYYRDELPTPCLRYCFLLQQQQRTYETTTTNDYYQYLAQSYVNLITMTTTTSSSSSLLPTDSLLVDCACGVGYMALRQLVYHLQQLQCMRRIVATNRIGSHLNTHCGAMYVSSTGQPPTWYNTPPIGKTSCASLAGDAEWVVLFSETETTDDGTSMCRVWTSLDILVLIAEFILSVPDKQLLVVNNNKKKESKTMPNLAIVVSTEQQAHVLQTQTRLATGYIILVQTTSISQDFILQSSFDVTFQLFANGRLTTHCQESFRNRCRESLSSSSPSLSTVTTTTTTTSNDISLHRLNMIPPLLVDYPDGLAILLLVDALLHVQGLVRYTDWKQMRVS